MVARVRIQSLPSAATPDKSGGEVLRLYAPTKLLIHEGGRSSLWIVDQAAGRAMLRNVTVSRARDGERVEVVQGLQASDKLVTRGRESLKPGQRVRIAAEEP
jgi:hypothetical protein